MNKILATIIALSMLIGCGPSLRTPQATGSAVSIEREKQRELAAKGFIEKSIRLNRVATRILTSAPMLAEPDIKTNSGVGIYALCKNDMKTENGRIIARIYRLRDVGLTVVDVIPETDAGNKLQAGDVILTVNGSVMKSIADFDRENKNVPLETPLKMSVSRAGKDHEVEISRYKRAAYNVHLWNNSLINAFADGQRVFITTGMVRFAETDDELALVVGHEVAHNLLGHRDKKKTNAAIGTVFDVLVSGALTVATGIPLDTGGAFGQAGALVYSKDFEYEADYLGLYLTSQAGFGISKAPDLWRRMAVENPNSIEKNYSATHPSTPERFVALERTVAEINKKKDLGLPLMPEKKD